MLNRHMRALADAHRTPSPKQSAVGVICAHAEPCGEHIINKFCRTEVCLGIVCQTHQGRNGVIKVLIPAVSALGMIDPALPLTLSLAQGERGNLTIFPNRIFFRLTA
jgi:hypothetical protein